jgi:hypothetical protein
MWLKAGDAECCYLDVSDGIDVGSFLAYPIFDNGWTSVAY